MVGWADWVTNSGQMITIGIAMTLSNLLNYYEPFIHTFLEISEAPVTISH